MDENEYEELKQKEQQGTLKGIESRRLHNYEAIKYEQYINSIIDKAEEDRTEEEIEELERWNEEIMRSQFTIVGGF